MTTEFVENAKKILHKQWADFAKSHYINSPRIVSITLVGSRAKGTARTDSDADFKILVDKMPVRLHVNPKTGQKTELLTNKDVATVDFTNFTRDTTINGVALDPFIVFSESDCDYWSPEGFVEA